MQLLELVTVTVYKPAVSPDKSSVVAALLQIKLYGALDPLTVKSIAPVDILQFVLDELVESETAEDPEIVIEAVA